MISIFVWISTILYGFLTINWRSDDLLNGIVKFLLFALTILGVIILYHNNGFTGIEYKP
uniref:Uncharacterized protein n=1 Tax=Vibrio phage P018-4 TaxID=3229728 RepID=A0AB39AJW8_9CAUD